MKIIAATVRRHHTQSNSHSHHTILYVESRWWHHIFKSNGQTTATNTSINHDAFTRRATWVTCKRHTRIVHVWCAGTGTQLTPTHSDATQPTDGINRVYLNKFALRSEQFTFNVQTVHTEPFLLSIGRFYTIYVFYPYKNFKSHPNKNYIIFVVTQVQVGESSKKSNCEIQSEKERRTGEKKHTDLDKNGW